MAAVHLAVTGGIGAHRACAVKTVAYRPGERDAELLTNRFLEEAAAVTRLSHENLVYVFDAGIVERQLYLAMEFIEGRTVADLMAWSRKQKKPLPLAVVLSITIEVLNGLAYVHRQRLVHRDVSPSNVMVSVAGAVKLLDFGLARSTESAQHTGLGMKLGKAGYAAPEQMLGGTADARSDLYSVGVMLWELLAGRSLTPADGLRPRDIAFVSPSKYEPSAPPELDESLRLAMATSPDDRFATATEFATDLSRYLAPDDHRKQIRQFVEANFAEQLSQEKMHRESLVLLAAQQAAEPAFDPKNVGPMSSPADYVGTVLDGRYELIRLVGSGSMGAVYEGNHKGIGRKVAIKIPFLHGSADLKERFIREARATNRISDPHVVDITDAGETPQGDAYVVMDFLEGRDLEKWNAERKIWPPDEAVDVVVQIARGLQAAHEAGVVHRDLKPSNVMMVETRQGPFAKVLDFGVAKLMQTETEVPLDGLTRPETALGTPRYMAPEQIVEGRPVDARSDIYAAATILYEMLSGKSPYLETDTAALCWAKVNTPAKPLDAQALQLPPSLCALVMEGLSVDPNLRPTTAAVWRSRLESTRPERRRGTSTLPVVVGTDRSKGNAWRLPVVVAALAMAAGAVVLFAKTSPPAVPVEQEALPRMAATIAPAVAPPSVVVAPATRVEPALPAPAEPVKKAAKAPSVHEKGKEAATSVPQPLKEQAAGGEEEEAKNLEAAEQALVTGDFSHATRAALEALSVRRSARAYAMLARVHLAQGETKAASAVVQEGVQRYPTDRALVKLAERLK
jgi:serine/threonine protein kinase